MASRSCEIILFIFLLVLNLMEIEFEIANNLKMHELIQIRVLLIPWFVLAPNSKTTLLYLYVQTFSTLIKVVFFALGATNNERLKCEKFIV